MRRSPELSRLPVDTWTVRSAPAPDHVEEVRLRRREFADLRPDVKRDEDECGGYLHNEDKANEDEHNKDGLCLRRGHDRFRHSRDLSRHLPRAARQ